jgi:hypothetical protein
VRALLLLAVVGACGFEPGKVPVDAVPSPPDVLVPTWTVDVASNKGVPASASDWSQVLDAARVTLASPAHLWLAQEAAGPLDDSIGSIDLLPQNGPSYANLINGWTRTAVGTVETAGDQGFITGSIGNLDATPYLIVAYVGVVSPPSTRRSLIGIGAGVDHRYVAVTSAMTYEAAGAGVVATTGSHDAGTPVHPVVIAWQPGASMYAVYTDEEKLSATWIPTVGAGPLFTLGSASIGAAPARYLYCALWSGTGIPLDDAAIKRLLQTLGWSVTGY